MEIKELLVLRFKTILKEFKATNKKIENGQDKLREANEVFSKVYNDENSEFSAELEEAHRTSVIVSNEFTVLGAFAGHCASTMVEIGKILTMVGEELPLDSEEDKDLFAEIKTTLSIGVEVIGGNVHFINGAEFNKQIEQISEKFIEQRRTNFEIDKQQTINK